MLFNSYHFIFIYLPIVFLGTFFLGRHSHRLAALWLGLSSLAFYAVWDARFLILLLASIAFNCSETLGEDYSSHHKFNGAPNDQ